MTLTGTQLVNDAGASIASVEAGQTDKSGVSSGAGVWGRVSSENLGLDSGDRFSADEHTFIAQSPRLYADQVNRSRLA